MTDTGTATSIRATTTVPLDPEAAFRLFTEQINLWWHPSHHIIEAPLDHMVFEPRVGGHVYDVGTDGSECHWSRVLAYDPPDRLVISWDITSDWQVETDPARASEIEVLFTPVGEGTRVDVEHRNLDRHGPGWEAHAQMIGTGWQGNGLDRYAALAEGGPVNDSME